MEAMYLEKSDSGCGGYDKDLLTHPLVSGFAFVAWNDSSLRCAIPCILYNILRPRW